MLEIIFVRHGETETNKKKLFSGWTNSKLTKKGIQQAEMVCEKLKNEKLNMIICSDLDRCLKTAQIINKHHGVNIIEEPGLREINFGKWENLSYGEICEKYPEKSKKWEKDFVNFIFPDGESLYQMYDRVNGAYKNIVKSCKNGKILIVSHSGVIRAILSQEICKSIDGYWKFNIYNCGIARLQYVDGFPVLIAVNQ
ncbi:alpha-ribazole phosphatase [Caminicella sporogenes DSM 14501]|uniref:Alpha-ribazole phosphatase n=1 Tax=Caminicella sporogenes DSM 14501 TaxID=1121266 RepID=A0A1M6MU31_9FIRM|nr:alpha-ribazole phosphatase [Caminicella sporogenes]RKD22500.1 alpha-ribazole phosphatase [Caminicella sporogenes]SHJ86964.1 alpha-ribazole phosphatase [Caminicella sporogenes DSM 14501]